MKKRIVSGIQSSGTPHLGNYLGAMKNCIDLQKSHESYIFIADLHSLTTVKDPEKLQKSIIDIALDYLSLGLDPEKAVFFRQSHVPEHSTLAWIFNCITPFGLLERAHAWKDAKAKGTKEPTAGLFTYPILMAADILLYHPELVPVGKDQKQHIEIARDIAHKFNLLYGETFPLPEEYTPENVATVPGTDGEKMSKSYKNTIDIFAEEKVLEKQVMSIKTDSTPKEAPKNPENCNIFKLYSFFASAEEIKILAEKYRQGNFGYGEAKRILLEKLIEYFKPFRQKRIELSQNLSYVEDVLAKGAIKAQKEAQKNLNLVKKRIGLIF